jgi:hypothetical protein
MKIGLKKFLLGVALATGLSVGHTVASAAVFPDFTVNEGSVTGAFPNIINADKIVGGYVEIITFTPGATPGTGTFDVSLMWVAGQYFAADGTVAQSSQLGAPPGFPNTYQLYALYQGSGTFVTSSSGVTTFTTTPGSGSFSVLIDPTTDTTFIAPATGSGAWTTGASGDDYVIATGIPQQGTGTLDPSLPTCRNNGPINCGSFGTSASFALEALGRLYFTAPINFYDLSFQAGQLNNFTPTGTQQINGSMDVVFARSAVPEPASLALLGIGLVGLAFTQRRRPKA